MAVWLCLTMQACEGRAMNTMLGSNKVKGDPKQVWKLALKCRKYAYIPIGWLHVVVYPWSCNRSANFCLTWAPPGAVMLVRCLPMDSWKRLAHDIMYASAMHPSLIDDITDADWQTQNGWSNGRFQDFQMLILNKLVCISTEKLLWVYILFRSYW